MVFGDIFCCYPFLLDSVQRVGPGTSTQGLQNRRHPEIATFTTQVVFSHPDSILLPTGTQIRHLSRWQEQLAPSPRIVCTFDTQTLLYCPFTPYYSGITAVMVEWVPDARHCFFLVTLVRRTVCPR
jgi:hypothetical protein